MSYLLNPRKMPQSPNVIISDAFLTCLERETLLDLSESDKNSIYGYLVSLPAKKVWNLLHDIPPDTPVSSTLLSEPLELSSMFDHSPNTDQYMTILDTIRVRLGMPSWFPDDSHMVRHCREELMLEECEETFTLRDMILIRAFVDVLLNISDEDEEESIEESISQGVVDDMSMASGDTDETAIIREATESTSLQMMGAMAREMIMAC